MVELNYSKNTVGCNVGGEIFIHPELYKHPGLYHVIVEHEKRHTGSFRAKDVAIDFFNDDLEGHKKEFYKFMFSHPRTLLGYLPVSKIGKYWGFDLELAVAWLLLVGMGYFIGVNL